MNKLDGQSMDLVKENVEKLKELFPSIVKEDKIDFDELELLLGENINRNNEQYSFTWNGKTEATKLAQKRSTGTLRPCKEESKDWDTTQNLYIEGDNLEVLRLLQASYNGRIKMIYIDPPYNTGHDFVYKDNFEDNIKNYKEQTGQAAKSNADTDGRYHTNWLNMMYPRLKLARNLLTDDGAIFVSIDDNEYANLKKICDDVFGENNFICKFVRKSGISPRLDAKFISVEDDLILFYAKNISKLNINKMRLSNDDTYNLSDEYVNYRGKYKLNKLDRGSISYSSNMDYPIMAPDNTEIYPGGKKEYNGWCWRWSKEKVEWGLKNGFIVIKKGNNNQWSVYFKQYQFVDNNDNKIERTIPYKNLLIDNYYNELANRELNVLFDGTYFDYPKPTILIKTLLKILTDKTSIILDFFSGSATTAHAVMQLNAEDGGNRKFIMVQLPELTDEDGEAYKAGYKNICEIGKERIRRAGEKIKEGVESFNEAPLIETEKDAALMKVILKNGLYEKGKDLFKKSDEKRVVDIGFKVFKLDSSNIKKWDNTPTKDTDTIKDRIQASMDYLKDDRNELDLVYEVMLKYGIDLSYPVRKTGNEKAYIVEAPEYKLLVCTMPNISLDDVESFANENVGTYLFADRCFGSDSLLINTEEILKSRNKEMRLF